MPTLIELRNVRLEKLNKLRELGVDPYPARTERSNTNIEIIDDFNNFENKEVSLAGRLMSIRGHGKLTFMDLKDATGKIQLYIKDENIQEFDHSKGQLSFEELYLLDIGDYVQASGTITKTKRGEISLEVKTIRLLTKSLRPLPDKWDGLKDREIRMRRRYVDTSINEDVFQRYIRRSKFWAVQRDLFKEQGFLEMNVPVLENIPGGADAHPFVTHMDAIDQDFYLRISHELYLKRLIGGGYEKVYEIGPRFRNEGLSDEHLPEHMAMEFYWAYADWRKGMEFIKVMYERILDGVYEGRRQFHIRGFDVDFSKGWEELDFTEVMKDRYEIDINNTSVEELTSVFKKNNIKIDFEMNIQRGVDYLWKNIRKDIVGPAFLINHPKYISPLSKSHPDNPNICERFQPIIAGSELGNAWSEINDPIDQFERFKEQQDLRNDGDAEAQWMDIDFVEMLEYGMPPTFGYGHSERLFWFLEDITAREGVPFPQLKHEIDPTSLKIYDLK